MRAGGEKGLAPLNISGALNGRLTDATRVLSGGGCIRIGRTDLWWGIRIFYMSPQWMQYEAPGAFVTGFLAMILDSTTPSAEAKIASYRQRRSNDHSRCCT
jgi:hypothetical protein